MHQVYEKLFKKLFLDIEKLTINCVHLKIECGIEDIYCSFETLNSHDESLFQES